jgi:hypothetical protein
LNGANSLTGSFNLAGGALALGAGGSLSPTGAITLGVGTSLDLSAAANQTIGSLAGLGGSVNLGSHTLTLGGWAYQLQRHVRRRHGWPDQARHRRADPVGRQQPQRRRGAQRRWPVAGQCAALGSGTLSVGGNDARWHHGACAGQRGQPRRGCQPQSARQPGADVQRRDRWRRQPGQEWCIDTDLNGANTFGGGWRSTPAAWCWATAVHWEPAH